MAMLLPHVYQVTKYDPADRDEDGRYVGLQSSVSDHGVTEEGYVATVAAFAAESGVTSLSIREPEIAGFVNFGLEPPIDGHGLAGLFPADLTGYHDGALVPVQVGLELVRAMLRDNGAWCRLEVEDRFFIHVGYDQYLYVGSTDACPGALATTAERGLFAEPCGTSPWAFEVDGDRARPADRAFWAEAASIVTERGRVLLEERYLGNATRWHRLGAEGLADLRVRLAPRSCVAVWPDLSSDVEGELTRFASDDLVEIVWQRDDGNLTSRITDDLDPTTLASLLKEARAAKVLPCMADQHHPLLAGVLPDPDGTLRARWTY
jgi:hypothetical protein